MKTKMRLWIRILAMTFLGATAAVTDGLAQLKSGPLEDTQLDLYQQMPKAAETECYWNFQDEYRRDSDCKCEKIQEGLRGRGVPTCSEARMQKFSFKDTSKELCIAKWCQVVARP